MKNIIIISVLFLILVLACSQSTAPDENPEWVTSLIKKYENESVGNPPQSIWRYNYNGGIVYYVPAQCCDQPSTLYDISGNVICAPDGGYFGRGDGRCPDFFQERENEKLIWQDPRK